MELKRYLKILWDWWWLVIVAFVTVMVATIIFTYTLVPQYETEVRLILKPTVADLQESRSSLAALDKPNVANTYAEIGQSPSIIQASWDQLGIPKQSDFEIRTSVLQQTNIVIITVNGPDPTLVQQLASAVTEQTLAYVAQLYEVYILTVLDPPQLPSEPVSPNKTINLAMGLVLGLGLGVVVAFLAHYLQTPLNKMEEDSMTDPKTGAYKYSYFLTRLDGEISRAKRNQRPFVVSIIRLGNFEGVMSGYSAEVRQVQMKQIVQMFKQTLPEENLLGQWYDHAFALLMPDCDLTAAQRVLEKLQEKLVWTAFEIGETGMKANFYFHAGLAEYSLNDGSPKILLDQAEQALHTDEKSNQALVIAGSDADDLKK